MPAYLVIHVKGQREDMLIEDPALTLTLSAGWARFKDERGLCLAIPAEQVATIQRVDDTPEDTAPKE